MPKRKLYFSCALSGLPIEHRQRMVALRDSLKVHFDVLEFCDPKDVTARDIYRYDIHHCVAIADLMLAVVDERGTGLGYEMGVMIEKHDRPVLAVAHQDSLVSPFILGVDHRDFKLVRYNNLEEVPSILLDFEREIFVEKKPRFKLHDTAEAHGFRLPPR